MLHTLNKSTVDALNQCVHHARQNDALVLLEDGVYCGIAAADQSSAQIDALLGRGVMVYAIDLDVEARGLVGRLADAITVIGYDDFVRLATEHPTSKRW